MTQATRIETDALGELSIPLSALRGIHTQRAVDNFPAVTGFVNPSLIHAFAKVKLAAIQTNHELGLIDDDRFAAVTQACEEMMAGDLDSHFPIDALQGGAGTSTNMSVNEVLTNRALQILGRQPGDYDYLHPLHHLNLHQSTNDTYPTALKIAAILKLQQLEEALVKLQEIFQQKEKEFSHIVKVGRTQLQDAVLVTLGREMSAYAEAFGRDRWRVYKCVERLRVVNLGGTAVGTGITAPRRYIFRAVELLRDITGIGLARAENLIDATQNTDVFIEVSGILKACAGSLFKVANDLRLLSSGPENGIGEIRLPARQSGSSIMPQKVNPVIPEFVIQSVVMAMANDMALTQACSLGNLELNAFMPLVAHTLLQNLDMLTAAALTFNTHCVAGITANEEVCRNQLYSSTAVATALVERLGYKTVEKLVYQSQEQNITLRDIVIQQKLLTEEEFSQLTSPEAVTRLGSPGAGPGGPQ